MNARQKRFCAEYLIDCNATQAAIRAGYSLKTAKVTAAKLLKNGNIKAEIEQKLQEIQNERIASAQEVLTFLTAVMRGEQTEQTLKFVGEGIQTITNISVGAKDRIKAAELLGKRYALFKDTVEVGGSIPIVISGSDDLED